ncbi:MAG: hypothetical protein AABZ76_07450 [Pseudomonadota bacterium]
MADAIPPDMLMLLGRLDGKLDGIQTTLTNMAARADGHEAKLNDHEVRITTIESTARTSLTAMTIAWGGIAAIVLPLVGYFGAKLLGLG